MLLGQVFDDVLAAAKTGAEWAWVKLYRSVAGQMIGYLRNRGAAEPEDLASEVFLKVARSIHTFEGDEQAFRSWVFVIAHRTLIDQRRAAGRRPEIVHTSTPMSDLEGGNVEGEAMERLSTEELRRRFDELTDSQRDVLALRIIAGLTLEETAHAVGKSVGAVKALQHRAIEALQERIDSENVTI